MVIPLVPQPWQILNTLVGAGSTATVEVLGDVQRVRVKTAGLRDAVFISSARISPKLTTTKVGSACKHDPTKINGILAARTLTVDPAWADVDADVYVEQADGLQLLNGSAPPVRRKWIGTESSDGSTIVLVKEPY